MTRFPSAEALGSLLASRKRDWDLRLRIGGVELVELGLDGVALAGHVEIGRGPAGTLLRATVRIRADR